MELSTYLTVRLSPELRDKIEQLAQRHERKAGDMIRVIVKRELRDNGLLPDTKQQPVTAVSGQGGRDDGK
jgi:hypothetical protein